MDAGVGDDVIIAYGHAARVAAWEALLSERPGRGAHSAPPIPIDAAIVAVVDNLHVPDEAAPGTRSSCSTA
jgi:microcompartment protein CcmK/EutM